MHAYDLDTPALLLNLDAMERNVARMAATFRDANVGWRPHTKAIKVPELAHKLIAAGAHGVDGVDGPIGLAVKVEDGNGTILTAVVTELVHQLGIGTASQRAQLDIFRAPPIRNTVGLDVGHIEVRIPLARQAT